MSTKRTDEQAGPQPEQTRRSGCPIACALDVVGDRWTLLILRDLFRGRRRYGELLAAPEKIPTNILAERLKRLEREGLIQGVPYTDRPRRLEYHLTPKGSELGQVLEALARWGWKHMLGREDPPWPAGPQPQPEPAPPVAPEQGPSAPQAV